jgi:glycosyltransferase involved in cell wall biosynthesis
VTHQQVPTHLLPVGDGPRVDTFSLAAAERVGDYDLVHAFTPVPGGARTLWSVLGMPSAAWLSTVPSFRRLMQTAADSCGRIAALTGAAADAVAAALDRPRGKVDVLPPGIRMPAFPPRLEPRTGPPRVLFVGDVTEPRKRLDALVAAVDEVAGTVPELELLVSGGGDPSWAFRGHEQVLRRTRLLGVGERSELPALYRSATVTSLPSVDEAFGLVVVESLASGTPVLVAPGSGPAEIVGDAPVGCVTDDLAAGLSAALELARDPETPAGCVGMAQRYDWDLAIGPAHERWYRRHLPG